MTAARLTDAFLIAAGQAAARLRVPLADWLAVMNSESGLDPAAHNPGGATGMGQIMPVNFPGVGFRGDWQELAAMSPEEQLPYNEAFLRPYAGKGLTTHQRIHQALFLPATLDLGSDLDLVLAAKNGTRWNGVEAAAYKSNAGALDPAKKGAITVDDLRAFDARASGNPVFRDALSRIPTLVPAEAARTAALAAEFGPGGGGGRALPIPAFPNDTKGVDLTSVALVGAGAAGIWWAWRSGTVGAILGRVKRLATG